MTLWLIGMMGSGKSTAGRRAAELADVRFIDLDSEIERDVKMPIFELWSLQGEAEFRELERRAVRDAAGEAAIVSTGGGAVMDSGSRDLMKSTGKVVWLLASPPTLASRIRRNDLRPLLEGDGGDISKLGEILEKRESIYAAVSDVTVDTEDRDLDEVAAELVSVWQS